MGLIINDLSRNNRYGYAIHKRQTLTFKTTIPPKHQWVKTDDGSFTLFSEAFQETCHSSTGAKAETLFNYIVGCQIKEQLNTRKALSVLEVGFGLGIGFLMTYDELLHSSYPWKFLSLEIDQALLEWFRLEYKDHPFLKNLKWNGSILEAKTENIHLIILGGDARKTLPAFLDKNIQEIDAIYQDAFSPKKNPILWTTEWFELLKKYSNPGVILSTYSSSSSIRKSLLEAGWILNKGPQFGAKRASTRATLQGTSNPDILIQLKNSPTLALRDDNF